jgi:cobalt-zinc-cadmium efflux system membrane fusion protein
MSMRIHLCMAGVLLVVLTACQRKVASTAEATPVRSETPSTATLAADMCAEHGVLEVVCTKCHPKLVAVFQAKGDWCAEHGFPESFCPICHPERGGRPATAVEVDDAPAEGTKIHFKTLQTAREAGLEVVSASDGPAGGGVEATATIVADASKVALVNARAPGVVHSIRADLGSRVSRGSPLADIESAAVGESRSRLQTARARAEVAEAAYRREQELLDKGISAARDVQTAHQEWEAARAELAAASTALAMVGTGGGEAGTYTLQAPIAGVVTRRMATIGTLVNIEEPLFEIVDTSSLWAEIDVPEREASRVKVGQRVLLRLDGNGEREFSGTLSYIAPVVDPHTRTVKARAAVANPGGALRANVYARARIVTDESAAVLVPRAALQQAKGVNLVFVRLAEDEYETRRVRVASADGDLVAVSGSLKAGDAVVTAGSFLLKTETMKEGIGAGCCDVEGPKK